MQIGGGVHVGDAFQAIVSIRPIAIWACVALCPNFSEDGTSTSRQTIRERRRCQMTVGNAEARGAVGAAVEMKRRQARFVSMVARRR